MTTAAALAFADRAGSFGLDSYGPTREAAGASAFVMIGLVAFLCLGILACALIIRHRSLHPSAETKVISEVSDDLEAESRLLQGGHHGTGAHSSEDWEKPGDWWKSEDNA